MTFEKENRYHVLKITDVNKALSHDDIVRLDEIMRKISTYRHACNKIPLECVVVESDWSIYEDVWALVESTT